MAGFFCKCMLYLFICLTLITHNNDNNVFHNPKNKRRKVTGSCACFLMSLLSQLIFPNASRGTSQLGEVSLRRM